MEQSSKKQHITDLNIFLLKYFNIIIFFIVILTLVASFFLILKPKYEIVKLKESTSNKNMKIVLEAKEKYKTRLIQYKNHYNDISQDDRDRMDEILPPKYDTKDLLIMFDEFIYDQGWSLNSVEIIDKQTSKAGKNVRSEVRGSNVPASKNNSLGATVEEIKINLSFNPGESNDYYTEAKNILSVFENQLKLMDLDSVNIGFGEGDVILSITTYYSN